MLWPILHYRVDLAEFNEAEFGGYQRVNEFFAERLSPLLEEDDVLWVHDYHLIPLASALRQRGHGNRIGFFLHIPMPPADLITALPHHDELLRALTEYNLIGFQTENDASNFARYLTRVVGAATPMAGATTWRTSIFASACSRWAWMPPVSAASPRKHRRARPPKTCARAWAVVR